MRLDRTAAEILRRIDIRLSAGGLFLIGAHESLPELLPKWRCRLPEQPIYRKVHSPCQASGLSGRRGSVSQPTPNIRCNCRARHVR
ncbi:copper resistance protein A homolog [Methylocaldum marinum]|uniref:Copper resistance protein A homolog n=1 Tax=Methylocaldum marinum TaxID=1432792 RepID=A0A286P4B3_9GAMM|nr:copper resistance protein A homolog [Methylocaldum marinum]